MKKILKKWFNWLFPLRCAGCGKEDQALCPSCAGLLVPFNNTVICLANGCALDAIMAVFLYEKNAVLARLLHLYKYELIKDYGEALISAWKIRFPSDILTFLENEVDLITWIPLHTRKFRSRGFNQAKEFAMSIPCSKPTAGLLRRCKNTAIQMTLSREERLANMQGAFELIEGLSRNLKGLKIAIVDDVYTTGATLDAAAKILKQAGAAKIYGLVLSRQKV